MTSQGLRIANHLRLAFPTASLEVAEATLTELEAWSPWVEWGVDPMATEASAPSTSR